MASRSRSCKSHPDSFCYICGEFKITDERNRVTEFIENLIMHILAYNLVIKTNHGLHM